VLVEKVGMDVGENDVTILLCWLDGTEVGLEDGYDEEWPVGCPVG
jgi:hypothetical protein